MARKVRNHKTFGAAALLAGTLALGSAQAATADPAAVSEQYRGRASAQVLDLSLLGRQVSFGSASTESSLESVTARLAATASGVGTTLAPDATRSVATFDDAAAKGGKRCATPALGSALREAATRGSPLLPEIEVGAACGEAQVTGGPEAFVAESSGGRTTLVMKLSAALRQHVEQVTAALDPALRTRTVGELVSAPASTPAGQAVGTINGLLGTLVPGVQLPQLEPEQKVEELLTRLESTDLLRVTMGTAVARNAGEAASYRTEGVSDGGVFEILPGFRGAGGSPLLKITVAASRAGVDIDRATSKASGSVRNAVVRVEGDLLDRLPVAGLPVVDGLVGGLPLSAVPGGSLPVAGGLLGGGLPREQLLPGLGVKSAPGSMELGPGQGVSVLCDGPVAPLCSEVSVGAAEPPVALPDGRVRAEASTVSIHLFKGLDTLVPGTALGTVLSNAAIQPALAPLASAAGLNLGQPTGVAGVKASLTGAVAEAGGTRVLGSEVTQTEAPPAPAAVEPAPTGDLPHTGGGTLVAALPLLAAGTALRAARRRTRR